MDTVDGLADDGLADSIGGTLLLSDDTKSTITRDISTGNLEAALGGGHAMHTPGPAGVAFQVVNYRIVRDGHQKYVMYSIVIVRANSMLDETPTVIDRRYSDFEHLNAALHKKSPRLMRDISFPRKKITGNFKPQTIAERSRAFEQFLAHTFSMDSLRVVPEFTDFFYGSDLRGAYSKLHNGCYGEAIELFKGCLGLQRKLLGDNHRQVLATLCALTASAYALDQYSHAYLFAESALKCATGCEFTKYHVPLLQLSIRLCWQLGKDKKDLENRLSELRKQGHEVDTAQGLLEVMVTDTSVVSL